jgi:hypothetical protein
MRRNEDSYGVFLEKPGSKRPLERTRLRKKMVSQQSCILKQKGREAVDWFLWLSIRTIVGFLVPERSKGLFTC